MLDQKEEVGRKTVQSKKAVRIKERCFSIAALANRAARLSFPSPTFSACIYSITVVVRMQDP
eukprot:987367-Pelagomonas_calceolata.AAC.1